MPKSFMTLLNSSYHHRSYQLQNCALECVPLSLDISPLHFFFLNFLCEDIYADDSKPIKELEDVFVSEFATYIHN